MHIRRSSWCPCLHLLRTSRLIVTLKNSINSTDALQPRYWTATASCQQPQISSWSRQLLNITVLPRIVHKHPPLRCIMAPEDSEQDITNGLRTGTPVTNHPAANQSAGDAYPARSMWWSALHVWTSNTSSSSQRSCSLNSLMINMISSSTEFLTFNYIYVKIKYKGFNKLMWIII